MPINEQERLEIVQDLIDRLIYLKGEQLELFMSELDMLFSKNNVEYTIVDGIRIYNQNKQ